MLPQKKPASVPQRPVRPRDSASLILLRRRGSAREILLGRRPRGSRFMPGVYVFPGGVVEAGDSRAGVASELENGAVASMAVRGDPRYARRLAVAAVRETLEETGLLVADRGDVGPLHGSSWNVFRQSNLAPALAELRYVGRAITPVWAPIRFHARFFLADATSVHGELGSNGELLDLDWIPIAATCGLPMADVTGFMLSEAMRMLDDEASVRRYPLFRYGANGPLIRYR